MIENVSGSFDIADRGVVSADIDYHPAFRLVRRGSEYLLQGWVYYVEDGIAGFRWEDQPTITEPAGTDHE